MGEEREDPQKLKRLAADSYDYDNDSRWPDYWNNVLIPPHMASRDDVVSHFKRKFYQRYVDPDFVVEPMSVGGSSSQPMRSSTTSSSSPLTNNQPRARSSGEYVISANVVDFLKNKKFSVKHILVIVCLFYIVCPPESYLYVMDFSAGSTNRTSGTSTTAGPGPSPTPLRWDRQTVLFSVNAWVFVVAFLAAIPLVPKHLSHRAYRLCFLGTLCSSLYSLYSQYGKPRAWNWQALQVYFQSIIASKDFLYFIYCLTFVTSHLCLKFALIPILCWSFEHVAKFLRRNFSRSTLYRKYLEEPCVWVESNSSTLNIVTSHAEIGLGFLLIISLFSWQRNIIQAFMYWQLLKLMYHIPVTAPYHQSVWAQIGRSVNPLIQRHAPFLKTPISTIQRWWLR
ncbi:hypothetical protein D0Y65_035738 [Glycine soja]|uniref:Transmembrane protein 33-like n=1 Tax=Glycine soja TaxID=3848 RepID=A0A445HBD0_GLYSO|nr:hypothetical protein D0Y65_035738 [Glycine soja]